MLRNLFRFATRLFCSVRIFSDSRWQKNLGRKTSIAAELMPEILYNISNSKIKCPVCCHKSNERIRTVAVEQVTSWNFNALRETAVSICCFWVTPRATLIGVRQNKLVSIAFYFSHARWRRTLDCRGDFYFAAAGCSNDQFAKRERQSIHGWAPSDARREWRKQRYLHFFFKKSLKLFSASTFLFDAENLMTKKRYNVTKLSQGRSQAT